MVKLLSKIIIGTFTFVAFAACGGGGGGGNSNPVNNSAPVASAGPDQSVPVSSVLTLDGSASTDADGNVLTYSWSFTANPGGAALSDPTAAKPTFTPGVVGTYVLSLVVNDGTVDSTTDAVTITTTALSGTVTARYSVNGASWNYYVKGGNIETATDIACNPSTDTACLHGGEVRVVEVPGKTSCSGLTITETLGIFNWICDGSTNPVRMISTGFANGKNLSDLLDFATPMWKQNAVTVYTGATAYLTTASATWWSNPIVVDNDGGSLSGAGTIYVVTDDTPVVNYTIDASSMGLVGKPGVTINSSGSASSVSASSRDFLWLEGAVSAGTGNFGIILSTIRFSVLRNIIASNNDTGVMLSSSSNNKLLGVSASKNNMGIYLFSSFNNKLQNVTASNNNTGIMISNSSNNNTLFGVTASNNDTGIYLHSSSNNTLLGVTASNNNTGVMMSTSANNNTLLGITTSYNDTGIYLFSSLTNTLHGLAASNNSTGILFNGSSSNYITGPLKVGTNSMSNCLISGGTNPGLANSTCANEGSSDASLTTGITLASTFIGRVYNDTVNINDTGSAITYPVTPTTFDWSNFQNTFRNWGPNIGFGLSGSRNRWFSGDGAIWDWSILTTDTVIRNSLTLPTGDNTLTHTWSDATTTTHLRNAVEIQGDSIGNDNTLCESEETCLYTPNVGSYQGHGNLVSAGSFTNGILTGITLLKYVTNGY